MLCTQEGMQQVVYNMKSKAKIKAALKEIIINFVSTLPSNIKNKIGNLWFVFDEDSLMVKKDLIAFATHEPGTNTITFYLEVISRHDFDVKRLIELVIHEVAHAVGVIDESSVSDLVNKADKLIVLINKKVCNKLCTQKGA